jgi:hypothetical protein
MLGVGAAFMGLLIPMISHSMVALSIGCLVSASIGFFIWRFALQTR